MRKSTFKRASGLSSGGVVEMFSGFYCVFDSVTVWDGGVKAALSSQGQRTVHGQLPSSGLSLLLCPWVYIRVFTVSAGRTRDTLASHSESHCAGPKMCAGSEVRVLLGSCTGCKARQSHNLRESCWWRSASPHLPHCEGRKAQLVFFHRITTKVERGYS